MVTALALALPATAGASAYTTVERAYSQSDTGTLAPCAFSSPELEAALRQAPSYDFQYQADFTDAIEAALSARANGDCHHAATRTPPPRSDIQLAGFHAKLPGSLSAAGSGGLPFGVVLAFVLGAAGLLIAAAGLAFTGRRRR